MQMRGDIKTIEGDMKQFRDQQMYTNEGIFTLCSVLKDIMSGQGQKARGSRAQTLLDMFLNRTPKLPVHHNAVRFQRLPDLPNLSPPLQLHQQLLCFSSGTVRITVQVHLHAQ